MNSGREHLAITRMFMCVVVVILFDFVFLVLFVLPPSCACAGLFVVCVCLVWGGECSRAHGGCLGIKGR